MRVRRVSKGVIGGKERHRLRVVVDLRNDQEERLGWTEDTEVESVDHKDGILIREKRE